MSGANDGQAFTQLYKYNACLEFKFEKQHGLERIHFSDYEAQRKRSTLMRVYQNVVFVDKCNIPISVG